MKKNNFRALIFISIAIHCAVINKSAAQSKQDDTHVRYVNKFYQFTDSEINTDSALFYLKKIESNKLASLHLPNMIHEELAQQILNRHLSTEADTSKINEIQRRLAFVKNIIQVIMADTNRVTKAITNPLFLLSKIQDHSNDNAKLIELTNLFIKEELTDADIYSNRAGRYAFLIYENINTKDELKPLAERLLKQVDQRLKSGQININATMTSDELGLRAWYRYLYAYSNIIRSKTESDPSTKEGYLRTAYDYSPDVNDRQNAWGYFYDMYMLFGKEKTSFRDEYIHYLEENAPDKNTLVSTLLETALLQPEYKKQLETTYLKANGNGANFTKFWMASVNKFAQTAPPISLFMLDKSRFSTSGAAGKWLLIDFWGTWCAPCRSEHPHLQKFYDSVIKSNPDKITLLTIACRDTETKVTNYMKEKTFSFPVAMSDNQVEKAYKVPGYPTKLLITPEGKYLMVPTGSDWISFVKHYADL